MSHEREMLVEAVEGVIGRHASATAGEGFDRPAWEALAELGFTSIAVPEALGGGGGTLADAAAVVRACGRLAPRVPLADAVFIVGWLAVEGGLEVPPGPAVAAPSPGLTATRADRGWRLSGRLAAVPWVGDASSVFAVAGSAEGPLIVWFNPRRAAVALGANRAGEPRGDLLLDRFPVPERQVGLPGSDFEAAAPRRRGALCRALQMVGAMEEALRLTVDYVSERVQFDRPLARFQAVQQETAALAGELIAAANATQAAVAAVDRGGRDASLAVAVAKARAGAAAGAVAAIAHQLHGAIGFTDEYPLHRATRRLWSWRDEFGTEAEWSELLGREAVAAQRLFPLLTGTA